MFSLEKLKAFLFVVSFLLSLTYPTHAATYTIAPNDSLYKIAKLFHTSITTIMKTNNLSSYTIYPGKVLNVPCDVYMVRNGDTLFLISERYGLSIFSLRVANNEWDNYLYPGQKLNLPGIFSYNNTSSYNETSGSVISYSSADLDLLARLITAEADSQPYQAKVGVGAVVINRVNSSDFPNSLSGVIYQKNEYYYQFTPVENGWIYRAASQDAKNAAYDALHGSDPTRGAIYYFDDSATNQWLWSRTIAARIGKMVFTY